MPAKLVASGRQRTLKMSVGKKWWAALSQAYTRLQRWLCRTAPQLDVQQTINAILAGIAAESENWLGLRYHHNMAREMAVLFPSAHPCPPPRHLQSGTWYADERPDLSPRPGIRRLDVAASDQEPDYESPELAAMDTQSKTPWK